MSELITFALCFIAGYFGSWLVSKVTDLLEAKKEKTKITLLPDGKGGYYSFKGSYQMIQGNQK